MGGTRRSATLAWLGFALLALLAATGWSVLTDVDAAVADRFHRFGTDHPGWVATMHGVTLLGTGWVLVATNVVAVAICLRTSRYRAALLCAGAALCTWYSTQLAKSLTSRARPTDAFWPVDGFAFPSGHTSSAAAAAGVAVIAGWPLVQAHRRGRIALLGVAIAWPLLVGLSRMAGGVHWASDVVGGWLLALGWLTALAALADRFAPDGRATPDDRATPGDLLVPGDEALSDPAAARSGRSRIPRASRARRYPRRSV